MKAAAAVLQTSGEIREPRPHWDKWRKDSKIINIVLIFLLLLCLGAKTRARWLCKGQTFFTIQATSAFNGYFKLKFDFAIFPLQSKAAVMWKVLLFCCVLLWLFIPRRVARFPRKSLWWLSWCLSSSVSGQSEQPDNLTLSTVCSLLNCNSWALEADAQHLMSFSFSRVFVKSRLCENGFCQRSRGPCQASSWDSWQDWALEDAGCFPSVELEANLTGFEFTQKANL